MPVLRKLNAARKVFHASKIEKTGHNKFAGYKYFELGDFIVPALQIFEAHDLCGVVSYDKDHARLTITDLEDGSECVITSPMSTAALKGCHEVQNLGAVQTYIRRYLWVAALEIVEHDAIDSSEPVKEEKKQPAERTVAMKMVNAIKDHISNGRELGAIQQWEEATDRGEDFARLVWNGLTTPERDEIRRLGKTMKEAA